MRPPMSHKGFKTPDLQQPIDAFTKIYMLLKNPYGIKDSGSTWFNLLKDGIIDMVWEQ